MINYSIIIFNKKKDTLTEKNKKNYLIASRHSENAWMMQGTVEVFRAKKLMPNAALATLMTLTPSEKLDDYSSKYHLFDKNISKINMNMTCDLMTITGSMLHSKRIKKICISFRKKGIKIPRMKLLQVLILINAGIFPIIYLLVKLNIPYLNS